MKKLQIPAKLLQNGDKITWSQRYGYKLRGEVKGLRIAGNMVFVEEPKLQEEDVAFQANESVRVDRPHD